MANLLSKKSLDRFEIFAAIDSRRIAIQENFVRTTIHHVLHFQRQQRKAVPLKSPRFPTLETREKVIHRVK